MGTLIRSKDWAETALGAVETWSPALRTMVGLLLHNEFPSLLLWGPEFIQLYNDAYRPVTGDKHPQSLGQPARECWPEIWDVIGPMLKKPFRGEGATTSDDLFLLLNRNGFLEETHFKVAYSPVPDEIVEPTGIGGVLATVAETTEQVYGERQLRTLGALSRAADAKTALDACKSASETFRNNGWDIPFALFYLLEPGGAKASLAASVGFSEDALEAPLELALGFEDRSWPLGRVLSGGRAHLLDQLSERFSGLPRGPWAQSPEQAILLPLASPEQADAYGVLVCGLSPHRAPDDGYRTFFELAAAQLVTAIRNAHAHEAERQRVEALTAIDRAKTAFFSNISHEFRTPLTLMLGPTDELLSGTHGELAHAQRVQLEVIRRNELRLQRLVNALLDFSRIEAGRAQAFYEPTDLATLTRDIASSFRSLIERTGLEFSVSCSAIEHPTYVDRAMWEQIVANLLSNAFKFTFEGGIGLHQQEVEGGIQLVVRDTGVGIRNEDMPRLFERFHRIEGTRARTHEGSGIGLALVHELVEMHGGTLEAKSDYGSGTTFTVFIPHGSEHLPTERLRTSRITPTTFESSPFVAEALRWFPDPSSDTWSEPPELGEGQADTTPLGHILIADDNADMRDYLCRILGRHWRVKVVKNGTDALESIRAEKPAVILSDIMMPDMDGFRFLREIRTDPLTKAIPFIMLSARAGEEARIEGLEAGVDDYLVKPFSARELVARVRSQLENTKLRLDVVRQREQLAETFAQAPVAFAVLQGIELVFELANPACQALLHRDDLLGKPALDVLPGARSLRPLLLQVLDTGQPWVGTDVHIPLDRKRDGSSEDGYFSFVVSPVRDKNGHIDRLMIVASDVTDVVLSRRRSEAAEEENRRSSAELQRALKVRDEFLAIASHELRTPLTTLGLQIDGMVSSVHKLGPEAPPRLLHKAEKLRTEADRLEQLIEGMFEVFELSQNPPALTLEETDLAHVGNEVVERLAPQAQRARSTIEVYAEPTIGRWDRRRLDQVLTQLLLNALKFGGGKVVRLAVQAHEHHVRLTVTDGGVGIAPEHHLQIFDRFGRATSSMDHGGFGVGLWVVRTLVSAMKGTVQVESDIGLGATFVVELPRTL